jgi:hypothetical protein
MQEKHMDRATLLNEEQAAGCALSFLAEHKDQGESGASIKRMSGELHMLLQLFHTQGAANGMMERMGKGLRREFPRTDGVKDTIWDIDVLLNYIHATYPQNESLARKELLHKTMLLFMIFAASRPVELARMETPDPKDVGPDEARVRAIPKQRGNERTSVVIHRVSTATLCPLQALKEWLRRRGDQASPQLFTREVQRSARAARTSRQEDASPLPNLYQALTSTYIRAEFKKMMLSAGIPGRYPPYSIRHAVVTALFARGASDEEVVAYGRWSRGSRVPRLFYFIHATDGAWIGEKLLAEQPALRSEAHTRREPEESEDAEVESGGSEGDSSRGSDTEEGAERQQSAVLHDPQAREGHGQV